MKAEHEENVFLCGMRKTMLLFRLQCKYTLESITFIDIIVIITTSITTTTIIIIIFLWWKRVPRVTQVEWEVEWDLTIRYSFHSFVER